MKIVSIILAVAAFNVGLVAALLWYRASRVQIMPMWIEDGRLEPVDPNMAQSQWILAIVQSAAQSGELNQRAARWTAVAVVLSTAATLFGLL